MAYFVSILLFAPLIHAVPAPAPATSTNLQGNPPSAWASKKCTEPSLTDAFAPPQKRWEAADAQDAWTTVELSWNQHGVPAGDQPAPFTGYVGNFFHTKDGFNCSNMANGPCQDTIECADDSQGSHPAGFLIMNSFVMLHQIHRTLWDSLNTAMNDMQNYMGDFRSTFAPSKPDDAAIIKEILDVFAMVIGVGSAFVWNVVAKEAKWFTDDNYRGFAKDSVNAAIALGINSGKDNIPDAQKIQNDLSAAMGTWFEAWRHSEEDFVTKIFQGGAGNLAQLSGLIKNGMMLQNAKQIDLSGTVAEAKHIMYTKLIPLAWSESKDQLVPFILMTDNACTSQAEGDLKGIMSDNTAAETHVCYDNKIFYVVNPTWWNNRGIVSHIIFEALPGGTFDTLSGGRWGGVRLDDFVISAYNGYKLNGGKNGYQMPDQSKIVDGSGAEGDIIFGAGVQTPGFTKLPICDLKTVKDNLSKWNYESRPCDFPCHVGGYGGAPNCA